jgi:opacity protein-like surface antigen
VRRRAVFAIAAALFFGPGAAARGADLTLFGALSVAGGGDLNLALRGWEAYYTDHNGKPHTFAHDLGEMKLFPGGGAVLTIPLGKRFSLGVGGEFIRGATSGTVSGSLRSSSSESPVEGERRDILTEETIERRPSYELKGVAASLLAFYDFPIGRGLRAYLGAGPGLFIGDLTFQEEFEEQLETTEVRTSGDTRRTFLNRYSATGEERQAVRATTFGVTALAGVEVLISDALRLVFEAGARHAVWSDWEGTRSLATIWDHAWGENGGQTASGHEVSTTDGRLWAVEAPDPETGRSYDRLVFGAERPSSTTWKNVRSAAIDITGVSFRAGVRFRF